MKQRQSRALLAVAVSAALGIAGCADTDTVPRRGIDQDISATHTADGPTPFDLSQRSGAPWRASLQP